ncbi:MAG: ATP-dependent helicase, partial [Desulfobacterales bacterium]|nr:ATP-dependent helicase [Desulfobacterales bacterium]
SAMIKQANALLKGETDTLGFDESSPRDSLVGRLSHILVDEYQDIDDEQYELVSLLAGRTLQENGDQKLSILAVGDDDQNIYQFRGAHVGFIKRFREDYDATIHHLVENYRSTANIIAASNQLIAVNVDRMKVGHAIKINSARTNLPEGGNWQLGDPIGKGKVQLLGTKDLAAQAQAVLDEMNRIRGISDQFIYANTAVLAREWQELDMIRVLFEKQDIPVNLNWGKGAFPSFTKIREYAIILEALKNDRSTQKSASSLLSFLPENADDDNLWQVHLRGLIIDWLEETDDRLQPVSQIEEYLYEALSDQHRSQNLGNGVFLSTMHSVKGLEFDHVFVLGGSYSEPRAINMEEERRLLYVAMTRARETLQLFEIEASCRPHTAVFSGMFIKRRSVKPQLSELVQNCRYSLLGMTELYLGYAGGFNGNHQIHTILSRLKVGNTLKVEVQKEHIYLVTGEGVSVARFSKAAKSFWENKISSISEIKVLAMVRWGQATSTGPEYADRFKIDNWEIPICEVKHM